MFKNVIVKTPGKSYREWTYNSELGKPILRNVIGTTY